MKVSLNHQVTVSEAGLDPYVICLIAFKFLSFLKKKKKKGVPQETSYRNSRMMVSDVTLTISVIEGRKETEAEVDIQVA